MQIYDILLRDFHIDPQLLQYILPIKNIKIILLKHIHNYVFFKKQKIFQQ